MSVSDKALPDILLIFELIEKQELNMSMRLLLLTQKAGRDDLGVVPDKDISRAEVLLNIIKVRFIRNFTGIPVHRKQPGMISLLGRRLSNPLLRKLIVIRRERVDIIIKSWCIHR